MSSEPLSVPDATSDLALWTAAIADFRERFSGVSLTDPAAFEARRLAVAECRDARGKIETRRVELKRPALEFGRKVDGAAWKAIEAIEVVEKPMREANKAIEEEKKRAKRLAEQDERDKQLVAEAEALKAHQQRQQAEADAERARLKAESDRLATEAARLRAERDQAAKEAAVREAAEKLERDRVEKEQRAAREQLHKEREALRVQQEAAAKAEADRLAAIEAERLRVEKIEWLRLEEEKEKARLEGMRPDVDKVRAWGDAIDAVIETAPSVQSDEAWLMLNDAFNTLGQLAINLRGFGQ